MIDILNNKRTYTIISLFISLLFTSCTDNTKLGLSFEDHIAPNRPEIKEVVNINGGAILYYDVPQDKDLLCISASYIINGKEYEKQATPYVDSLKIVGFGQEQEYTVDLKSIDKAGNVSESNLITIHPKKAPVHSIFETLQVQAAFGGIHLTWENPFEENIIVCISKLVESGEWKAVENIYTNRKVVNHYLRGMESITTNFKIVIRDRWDNYSSTLEKELKPLFEEEADKTKFNEIYPLPGQSPANGQYLPSKIWDNKYGPYDNFNTQSGNFVAFDMGQVVKLSRFKIYHRLKSSAWYYEGANLKKFKVWGCPEITPQMRETGSTEGWTLLFEGETFKPSGNGPVTNEDKQYLENGDEHEVDLSVPPVRYIRIEKVETFSGSFAWNLCEVTFYGQIIKN